MGKPWENDGLLGFNGIYPLVITNIDIENGRLFMNFPIENAHFP